MDSHAAFVDSQKKGAEIVVFTIEEMDQSDFSLAPGDPHLGWGKRPVVKQLQHKAGLVNPDGDYYIRTREMVLVAIYAAWEVHRKLLEKELKIEKNAVTSVLFGDIRHIRNAILHISKRIDKPIATKELIRMGIQIGEEIILTNIVWESIENMIMLELLRIESEYI